MWDPGSFPICKMKMIVPDYPEAKSVLAMSMAHCPFPQYSYISPATLATFYLSRWLEAKTSRPDATCASPTKFRGQHIRDTDAFRSCKFPTKRSKKAGRH